MCIFWLHFFINAYLIKHNRHFLSPYFFVILSIYCSALLIFHGNWLIDLP